MATNKARIEQLEKQKKGGAEAIDEIRLYYVNEDGGAYYIDADGKRIEYTAAEYAEFEKQSAARGDICIDWAPNLEDGV